MARRPVDFSSLVVILTTRSEAVGGRNRSSTMSNGFNASYPDTSQELTDTMEEYWFNFISVVLGMIAIVGSPANLATIVMISRSKQLWNRQTLLILNLACADFFMATVGIALPFTSSIYRRWIFGSTGCILYGFATSLVGIAAITTLAFLAFDRSLVVNQSNWRTLMPTKTGTIVLAIWIYSFLVTGPPLFGWSSYVPEGPGISCSIDWEYTSWISLSYTIYLYVTGFFVQLVLIICSYASICLTVHEATTRELPESRTAKRAEARVAFMISVMLACFLIAWLPYSIVAIIKVWAAIKHDSSILAFLNGIGGYSSALLAKSSIAYNPIIYAFFNTQFRLAWKDSSTRQSRKTTTEHHRTVVSTNQIAVQRSPLTYNVNYLDDEPLKSAV